MSAPCGFCTVPFVARLCRPTCKMAEDGVVVTGRVVEGCTVTEADGSVRAATQDEVDDALRAIGVTVLAAGRPCEPVAAHG